MMDLLLKLDTIQNELPIEPRSIFMSLPDKKYTYPRDVQSDVWKKWYEVREKENIIIKMNTGSGKTVVGLLILQSCLNENKGPAVYVVPDTYLVDQVCQEAEKLGINTTTNPDDFMYTEKKSILVTTIYKLFNAQSIFGISKKYPIGSIIVDDAHACMNSMRQQFSIRINKKSELYNKVVDIFRDSWKGNNLKSYIDIIQNSEKSKIELIPFWIWQKHFQKIYQLLTTYNTPEYKDIYFKLGLIQNSLETCDCIISSNSIEIYPKGISISTISSFNEAKRKIYMSATLSDDSVFVSDFGIKNINNVPILTPDSANDIGDRMILFPKYLNTRITDDEIKNKVVEVSSQYNVVVIVPSYERSKFWDITGHHVINKDTIQEKIEEIKKSSNGFYVLVNRYDGVDLPDNACRLLVIDNLPPLNNLHDNYIQSIDANNKFLLRQQIEKIEQGMGRGVRSNNDSCCIILMGNKLADILVRSDGINYFSDATKKQYELSKTLWYLLKSSSSQPSLDEIFQLADLSLRRNTTWIQKCRNCLEDSKYSITRNVDPTVVVLRDAFLHASNKDTFKAYEILKEFINYNDISDTTKGYLLQVAASYLYFNDAATAQQVLKSAREFNKGVIIPITGIEYSRKQKYINQVIEIQKYFESIIMSQNDFVIYVDSMLDTLSFGTDTEGFEESLKIVGKILGFQSSRPDQETGGKGPDNLFLCNENYNFIIECKTGAISDTISKDYCNQLGGSVRWFEENYPNFKYVPIMVYKNNIIDSTATPVQNMRIITEKSLLNFKINFKKFALYCISNNNFKDIKKIEQEMKNLNLGFAQLLSQYTETYIIDKMGE